MQYEEKSYREMESYLRENQELCKRMGFTKTPSHSTLRRAMTRLSPTWFKHLNQKVVAKAKGGRLGARLVHA